jgi:hypothetical protein
MTPEQLQKALEEMASYAQQEVAAGFRSEEEIRASIVDILADTYPVAELSPHAARITLEALDRHLREQATWPAETDCDRLDAAFADLERAGIVARQDFSCCGTCGAGEIWGEMEKVGRQGVDVRGYAFYHMQDTENAVEGSGLYLNYGAVHEGKDAALAVAREIVAAIQHRGLNVVWDGSWRNRVFIEMDWKRRRRA